jgi:hypothetical protein
LPPSIQIPNEPPLRYRRRRHRRRSRHAAATTPPPQLSQRSCHRRPTAATTAATGRPLPPPLPLAGVSRRRSGAAGPVRARVAGRADAPWKPALLAPPQAARPPALEPAAPIRLRRRHRVPDDVSFPGCPPPPATAAAAVAGGAGFTPSAGPRQLSQRWTASQPPPSADAPANLLPPLPPCRTHRPASRPLIMTFVEPTSRKPYELPPVAFPAASEAA